MQTMTLQKFESGTPQILKEILLTGEDILIIQDGKPIVKIVKFKTSQNIPGKLAHTINYEKDIVTPLGESVFCYLNLVYDL